MVLQEDLGIRCGQITAKITPGAGGESGVVWGMDWIGLCGVYGPGPVRCYRQGVVDWPLPGH
jgi:hypothetical protein